MKFHGEALRWRLPVANRIRRDLADDKRQIIEKFDPCLQTITGSADDRPQIRNSLKAGCHFNALDQHGQSPDLSLAKSHCRVIAVISRSMRFDGSLAKARAA